MTVLSLEAIEKLTEGHIGSHLRVTPPQGKPGTKKSAIISLKLIDPSKNLREIAEEVGTSHGYARKKWAEFVRSRVTIRGSPLLPFQVHGWFYWNQIPVRWLDVCPLEASVNRNGQRVFRGKKVSAVFHKRGQVFVYPYFGGWKKELASFLESFWHDDQTSLFLDSLVEHGRKEIAVHAPGVTQKFKFHVKGLGKFETDSTPWPDGTIEYVVDLGFEKRLKNIEVVGKDQIRVMEGFVLGMNQHMALITDLRQVAGALSRVVARIDEMLKKRVLDQ